MKVVEFRYLNTRDNHDKKYKWWSRVYEYKYVLDVLKKLGATSESQIHNSSWGWEGCHITFKNDLDNQYCNTVHSDVKQSTLDKTIVYDITKKCEDKYKNYFDFVINVSTVEEVNHPNDKVLNNLLEQVKTGGYLIITFDHNKNSPPTFGKGSINLTNVEDFVNKKIDPPSNYILNGSNSILPNSRYAHLNCGVLVIQKE